MNFALILNIDYAVIYCSWERIAFNRILKTFFL